MNQYYISWNFYKANLAGRCTLLPFHTFLLPIASKKDLMAQDWCSSCCLEYHTPAKGTPNKDIRRVCFLCNPNLKQPLVQVPLIERFLLQLNPDDTIHFIIITGLFCKGRKEIFFSRIIHFKLKVIQGSEKDGKSFANSRLNIEMNIRLSWC